MIDKTAALVESRKLPVPPAPPQRSNGPPPAKDPDLLWLAKNWTLINDDLFAGQLTIPVLRIADLEAWNAFGTYQQNAAGEAIISLEARLFTGDLPETKGMDKKGLGLFIIDVLTHEMAHQKTHEVCDERGHGEAFLAEARRISALLRGFRKSAPWLTLADCKHWPMNCRKRWYYFPAQKLAATLAGINARMRACEAALAI
jgi:hypothetical protein